MARRDLTGQRFGRLVAIVEVEPGANWARRWSCRCDCGATRTITHGSLASGHARSCGCLRRESMAARNRARRGVSKGRKPNVSLSAATMAKLQAASRERGESMTALVELACAEVQP